MKGLERFDALVEAFCSLPGVGKKSAMRFAYFVTMTDSFAGMRLAQAIDDSIRLTVRCKQCGGLSEHELCEICSDQARRNETICVVENAKDILILEQSGAYEGLYFVLNEMNEYCVSKLAEMVSNVGAQEIIFAFTPGLSADAIMLYIEDRLGGLGLKFSKIAQGVPTGVSLENIDTLSLLKAMQDRMKA